MFWQKIAPTSNPIQTKANQTQPNQTHTISNLFFSTPIACRSLIRELDQVTPRGPSGILWVCEKWWAKRQWVLSHIKSGFQELVAWIYGECSGMTQYRRSWCVLGNVYWLTVFSFVQRKQLGIKLEQETHSVWYRWNEIYWALSVCVSIHKLNTVLELLICNLKWQKDAFSIGSYFDMVCDRSDNGSHGIKNSFLKINSKMVPLHPHFF